MEQVLGLHYQTGRPVRITLQGHSILDIQEENGDGHGHGQELPWVAPGLVDLQMNGYAGFDFNQAPLSAQTVIRMTRLLWREGVTSYYPTVITNRAGHIEALVRAIADACDLDPLTNRCIRGIHLEGPFISAEDGPRGAHGLEFVTAPDWELLQRWQEASGNRIKLLTMSPEWPESAPFIRKCAESGVTVSIGHTNASPEQIRTAVAAGASASTHLGNAAHLLLPRHPNYLWEQLAAEELWTCMIADGFHLPDSVLKVFLKVKGEKALLVSDAVYLAGMPPGTYTTHIGGRVTLAESGRLHLTEQPGLLAGSAQMLLWGIEHLARRGICSIAEAWEMSSIRPSRLMKLETSQGLEAGAPADLVLYQQEGGRLKPLRTYKEGTLVWEGNEVC